MARLVIDPNFVLRTELFAHVRKKDNTDGVSSIIRPFMTENSIALADDKTSVDAARIIHDEFSQLERDAEKKTQERNHLFKSVFEDHKKMVQYLKKFYKNNIARLGDWTVTVNGNKIVYPVDFINLQKAVLDFIAHHNGIPAGTSPLDAFLAENKIDIAQNESDASDAKDAHDESKTFEEQKETKRHERDNLMDPVTDHLEMIGNFLIGYFASNPNKAGDWGYTVDTSPQGDVQREGVINMGSPKKLSQLVVNSILLNTSSFPIQAFRGPVAEGEPVIIQPNIPFVIRRGWGTTTLKNPSDTLKATYKGIFHP